MNNKPYLLVDSSYVSFYRFFSTLIWYTNTYPDIEINDEIVGKHFFGCPSGIICLNRSGTEKISMAPAQGLLAKIQKRNIRFIALLLLYFVLANGPPRWACGCCLRDLVGDTRTTMFSCI